MLWHFLLTPNIHVMKEFLSTILIAIALLLATPAYCNYYGGQCGPDVHYLYDIYTGTLTLTGTGATYDYNGMYDNEYSAPWGPYSGTIHQIIVSEGITSVGNWIFGRQKDSETHYTLPSTLTRIGSNAFYGITANSSVTISANVNDIGGGAFRDGSMAAVTLDENNPWYVMEDGVIYNADRTTLHTYFTREGVTEFTVPQTVTTIGKYAFSYGLQTIVLPEGLTTIEDYGFNNCNALLSINLPSTLRTIGKSAFYGCHHLPSITFNDGLQLIDMFAFEECNALETIVLPASITFFGQGVFYKCRGLRNVTINSSAYFNPQMFYGCTSLESVVITNNTKIGSSMFCGCTALTNVTLPDNLRDIYGNAFQGCTSLTSIDLPASLSSIGGDAFNGCIALTNIELPASLGNIDNGAFAGCTALTNIEFPAGLGRIGDRAFRDCTALTSITLPDAINSIGAYAFAGCTGLTEAVFPVNLNSIGANIFDACPLLSSIVWNVRNASDATQGNGPFYTIREQITSFTLGSEVKHIPAYLLESMPLLTDVTLPASVQSIGAGVFYGCPNLQSVTMSGGVTQLGESAFYNCPSLQSVTLSDNIEGIGNYTFYNCRNLQNINAPSALTYVGDYAFYQCVKMTSFPLPDGVSDIGNFAFYMWNSEPNSMLQEFRLPEGLVNIGENALAGCYQIDSLHIGANVRGLKKRVFDGMTLLRKVTFAENSQLQYIGEYAFRVCENLNDIDIPASVDSLGAGAFADCTSLREVTIPENVRVVENIAYASISPLFEGCTGLKRVNWLARNCADFGERTPFYMHHSFGGDVLIQPDTIVFGDNVEHIPAKLCYKMSRLHGIEIPESVTSIGDEAFSGCTAVDSVICHIHTPLHVNANVFDGINRPETKLYVPFDAVLAYRTADVWKDFDIKMLPQDEYSGMCGETAMWTYTKATRTLRIHGTGAMTYNTEYEVFAADVDTLIVDKDITEVRPIIDCLDNDCFSWRTEGTFENLNNLKKVIWNARNATGGTTDIPIIDEEFEEEQYVASINLFGNNYTLKESLENFEFGPDVVVVPNGICSSMRGIRHISLPEGVETIGVWAFEYCDNMESITIPSTLKTIEASAFEFCTALTSLHLPEGLTRIGNSAFIYCKSLESTNWPSTVTSAGTYMFTDCESLRALPEGITLFTDGMFQGCKSIEEAVIPAGITELPNSVFYGCTSLRRVELPASLTLIGNLAFSSYDPISLEEIICHALTPPTLGREEWERESVFADHPGHGAYSYSARLSVPCMSLQLYRDNNVWGKFAAGECLEETALNDVDDDKSGISVIDGMLLNPNRLTISVYNVLGQRLYNGNEEHIRLTNNGLLLIAHPHGTTKLIR